MTARASVADNAGLALWAGDRRGAADVPDVDAWLENGDSARPGTLAAMATAAAPIGVTTGLCMRETGPPGRTESFGKYTVSAWQTLTRNLSRHSREATADVSSALRFRPAQQRLYLLDCVVDLHFELALPQLGGRGARIPGDPVVDPRRGRRGVGIRGFASTSSSPAGDRIADGGLDELLPDPSLVAAQVEHFRGVRDGGMAAGGQVLRLQVGIEVRLPLRIHVVAIEDVDALRRILRVELRRGIAIDVRLPPAVIAHEDHVLEAGDDRLLADALENRAEQ